MSKFYLAFYTDQTGNREEGNVFYSKLITANNREEALTISKRVLDVEYSVADTYDNEYDHYVADVREMPLNLNKRKRNF